MSFIIIAAAMLLAAIGVVVVPLLRRRRAAPLDTQAANRELRATRLQELQTDLDTGALAKADYEAARRDLEAEFQDGATTSAPSHGHGRGWWAAIAVAAVVPIVTAVLYLQWGNWQSALYGDQSLPAVTANVRARLDRSPNDSSGWLFLGRIASAAGRYDDAVAAFHRAVELTGGKNAAALAALGSTQMLADQMRATPAMAALFDKVLRLDPDNTRGLLFGGIAAMQRGDRKTAIARWQRLLQQSPPAPLRKILATRIVAAGGVVSASRAAAKATPAPGSAIQVDVKLAKAVKASVPDHATLFVFVRPADENGGPPLAVRRLNVDEFPVKVELSDADAMIPGRHLRDYKNLRVVARISKSGAPLEHAGDIFGSANFEWGASGGAPVDIVLNQVASD